jgi:uncharacterized protein YndB with AHSA1/START domain
VIRFRMEESPGDLPHGWTFRVPLALPPDRAFALLADPDAWPRWYPDIRSMRWNGPPGLGQTREVVTTTTTLQERFVVWEPGRRMAFTVDWMTIPLASAFAEDFTLTPDGRGSVLDWRARYRARLPFRPLRFALDPIFRRMFDQGVARLPAFAASWSG